MEQTDFFDDFIRSDTDQRDFREFLYTMGIPDFLPYVGNWLKFNRNYILNLAGIKLVDGLIFLTGQDFILTMRDIPEEIKEIPATVIPIYEKYFKRNAGSKLIKLPFSTRISIENFLKRKTERLSLRIFDEAVEKCVLIIAPGNGKFKIF